MVTQLPSQPQAPPPGGGPGGGGLKLGEFVKLFSWNKLTNSASSTMDEGGGGPALKPAP
jgi:hypothetical protein